MVQHDPCRIRCVRSSGGRIERGSKPRAWPFTLARELHISIVTAHGGNPMAGGPPFHTTQTKAVEFPGAALSPACRRQAAGEGAGLDATSPQSFREPPSPVRDPACTRSSPAPPPQFIAHLSSATVAHPRLPTPGSRECGTRNFNFTANPKTNQLLRQLPQWYHPPSPCVSRNRTN